MKSKIAKFALIMGKKTIGKSKFIHKYSIFGRVSNKLYDFAYSEEEVRINYRGIDIVIPGNERDDICRTLHLTGDYEPKTTDFILDWLDSDAVFIDIGAHIGSHTVLAAKEIGPDGHVYSFEPSPRSFPYLKKNVEINSLKEKTTIDNRAVSDMSGEMELKQAPSPSNDSVVNEHSGSTVIETVSLDELEFERVDIIKMDIEGSEPYALKGMRRILSTYKPLIIMEFGPQMWEDDPRQVLSKIIDKGYAIGTVENPSETINLDNLLSSPEKYKLESNIVLKPH
jgi:FkbM family methyltransferase